MNNKYTYFNFPLYLLQLTFTDDRSSALGQIIGWSIVNYADRLDLSEEEIAKQLDYLYHRNPDILTYDIHNILETNQHLLSEDPFKPELRNEVLAAELIAVLHSEDVFLESARLVGITYAAERLNIRLGSPKRILSNYYAAVNFMDKANDNYGRSPLVGIKTSIAFETRDGAFDLDLFRLMCSISSIIGKRKFNRTYKSQIILRMLGAKNEVQLIQLLNSPAFESVHAKFSKRYHIDKILKQAISRKLMSKIGWRRGIYVSTKYNLIELTKAIEYRIESYRALDQAEKDARDNLEQTASHDH
jgi:hypothetical protein